MRLLSTSKITNEVAKHKNNANELLSTRTMTNKLLSTKTLANDVANHMNNGRRQ